MKIIAHRGHSKYAPENTLPAFESAINLGAAAIEFDVHMTRDGELVVHHDYYLGSTDDGEGEIYNKDLLYIRKLDAGLWYSNRYAGQKIPLLKEVLDLVKGNAKTHIELELRGFSSIYVAKVLTAVKSMGLLERTEFTSPLLSLLVEVKKLEPNAKLGYFAPEPECWMKSDLAVSLCITQCKLLSCQVAHLPISLVTDESVKQLHEHELLCHVANCNSREAIDSAFQYKVDQFSTDDLELALSLSN